MTETTETVAVTRTGTGATASFSFPFKIASNDELEVTFIDTDDSETLLVEGATAADYAVTVTTYPGTGTITYPADSSSFISVSQHIHIRRKTPVTQNVTLNTQGGYNPQTQERSFDKITRITQEQADALARAPQVPETTSFVGLAGASPIVTATEDGFRWAVGFEGPAGADGAVGPPGPAGPWVFLGSYDLATLSTLDITDLGGSDIVALCLKIQGITISTDDAEVKARVIKNAGTKTTNYFTSAFAVSSSDTTAVEGLETDTSIPITLSDPGFGLGNVANEILDAEIIIDQPNATRVHNVISRSAYASASVAGPRQLSVYGSGRYVGTDLTAVLDGLNIFVSAGTFSSGTILVYGLRASNPSFVTPVTVFKSGVPSSSEVLIRYIFTDAGTFAVDYSASRLSAAVAATAQTVFNIALNGSGAGTITVAAAGTTGTFDNSAAGLNFVSGDVLTVIAPASPDATLANISINMRAILDL